MSKAQKMSIEFFNRGLVVTIILAAFIAGLAVDLAGCAFLFAFVLVAGLVVSITPYVVTTLITWVVASTR